MWSIKKEDRPLDNWITSWITSFHETAKGLYWWLSSYLPVCLIILFLNELLPQFPPPHTSHPDVSKLSTVSEIPTSFFEVNGYFFLCLKCILSKYSWFTMLCLFLLYSEVIQLYICIYTLFHILFHSEFSQSIEYSSLCCTVGLHCLSVPYIIVCIC